MANPEICVHELRRLYLYDPNSGLFWSLPSGRSKLAQAPRCRLLGSLNRTLGYVMVGAMKNSFYAHRLAWFYMTGKWPKEQIDHINGNRSDNRFCNLREASDGYNKQNRRGAQSDNRCGLLGVHWNKQAKRWQAELKTKGKKTYLGRFETPEEAHEAYIAGKRRLHHFNTL